MDSTVWLSAIATAALAEGLPGAVVASLALGWGAAALAQFCLGTPAATPSIEDLSGAVTDLGVDPTGLRRAPEQGWGSTKYTADGDVWIDVLSRDSTDARFLTKLWRFVWYKDSGPTFSLTRGAQVEHQAYVALLADQTGARSRPARAGVAGLRQDAIVAVRNPPGDPLSDLAPDQITDGVLDDAWSNLRLLHDERLAHGNPWVGNVVLDGDGTTGLVGLEDALSSASDTRLRLDRVQLLATHCGARRSRTGHSAAAQRALPERRARRPARVPRADGPHQRRQTPRHQGEGPPRPVSGTRGSRADRRRTAELTSCTASPASTVRHGPGSPSASTSSSASSPASPPWATSSRMRSGAGCC